MVNFFSKAFIVVLLVFGFVSCKKDGGEFEDSNSKVTKVEYVYKGASYFLKFKDFNGSVKLLEERDNSKINALIEAPTSAMLVDVTNQDKIYLFDNFNECQLFIDGIN